MLNLSNCSFEWKAVKHIAAALGDMPRLTDLILADNPALGRSAKLWSRYLRQMHHIETLNLSSCSFQMTTFEHVASVLSDMPGLTGLILADNKELGRSSNSWLRFLKQMRHMQTLNLSSCSLQWTDVEHIASSVADLTGLTDLILVDNTALGGSAEKWSGYLPQMTHIQTLNLGYCSLEGVDVHHIASSTGTMPELTNLIHGGNIALGGSARSWSHHILEMRYIQTLNLSNCLLQVEDIEHIALNTGNNPRLANLILSGNSALGGTADLWSHSLSQMRHIKLLNLTNCSLQCTDVEHIASSAGSMLRLTDLILAGNTALGGSALTWSRYLPRMTQVKTLDVSYCSLQSKDITHIASSVGDM
ncbi:ribonuclease inhibitor-like [Acanthaster planci]|uniref:Ribonuclease inhibitor-like n=1 Tax=Acanthaster planci TaxID=133434 RepID=A0A8B7YML4_ACAPL|nr:ribonuclease inhibitor-like [Acanthaster planci]